MQGISVPLSHHRISVIEMKLFIVIYNELYSRKQFAIMKTGFFLNIGMNVVCSTPWIEVSSESRINLDS